MTTEQKQVVKEIQKDYRQRLKQKGYVYYTIMDKPEVIEKLKKLRKTLTATN